MLYHFKKNFLASSLYQLQHLLGTVIPDLHIRSPPSHPKHIPLPIRMQNTLRYDFSK